MSASGLSLQRLAAWATVVALVASGGGLRRCCKSRASVDTPAKSCCPGQGSAQERQHPASTDHRTDNGHRVPDSLPAGCPCCPTGCEGCPSSCCAKTVAIPCGGFASLNTQTVDFVVSALDGMPTSVCLTGVFHPPKA